MIQIRKQYHCVVDKSLPLSGAVIRGDIHAGKVPCIQSRVTRSV